MLWSIDIDHCDRGQHYFRVFVKALAYPQIDSSIAKVAGCKIVVGGVNILWSENGKKANKSEAVVETARANHLATLQKRLLDLCTQDRDLAGLGSRERSEAETRYLLAIASDVGCLIDLDHTWDHIDGINSDSRSKSGSEHIIEYSEASSLVVKVTKPPSFGLIPFLNRIECANADPSKATIYREAIEFRPASPLEYLSRWLACNEVFGDDVRLISVIRWKCESVSLVITQPQYSGDPASDRDIVRYFEAAGWSRMKDPSGHIIFFHYGYGLLAIDAAGRNCYIADQGIQPFDVILCYPDEEIEKYLAIY